MNTARSLLFVVVASVCLISISGCSAVVSGMVQSQLNMNSSGPDFSVAPEVAGLGEAERFYAELLADADEDFASIKGEPLSAEEKRQEIATFIDTFERNTDRMVERGLVAVDSGDSIVRRFEKGFKRGEYAHLRRSAPGAIGGSWGKTVQQTTVVNHSATTVGMSFKYPISSKEEGREVLAQLEGIFNRILPERSKWVILDLAAQRAEYVKYAGYDALSAERGVPGSPYDWDTLAAGPISGISFTYRWKSQATISTGSVVTPAIDQVLVGIHNNLEEDQYNYQKITNGGNQHEGAYVIVSIGKSISVNGN